MALSKSRRFEIFKRDGFTCQYCGRRPPEVVLECDHLEPRALGGSDDRLNLVTACWDCNRGKAAKRLSDIAPRPDADLLFLEVQQEVAEARRYRESLALRDQELLLVIEAQVKLWIALTPNLDWHPSESMMRKFLNRYDYELVEMAVRDVAPKVDSGYVHGSGMWTRYMWSVLRNMSEERDG